MKFKTCCYKLLLQKEVIHPCMREEGGFISSAFTRKKKDQSFRKVLNSSIKTLNIKPSKWIPFQAF